MASSMMHLAVAEKMIECVGRPELFRLGCVLVDACGQAGHYRGKTEDGYRYYDLAKFRRLMFFVPPNENTIVRMKPTIGMIRGSCIM